MRLEGSKAKRLKGPEGDCGPVERVRGKGGGIHGRTGERCTWADNLTGLESLSLGASAYESALHDAGFRLAGTHQDEDDNHYYDAVRT